MAEDMSTGRRAFLRTGLLGAGGAMAAVGLAGSASASVTELPVQVIDVRAYGAKRDGSTDDYVAIQNALNAVSAPAHGTTVAGSPANVVYFPPGNYVVGHTLLPRPDTMIVGTHTVDMIFTEVYPSQCLLNASPTFSGGALISFVDAQGNVSSGVTIRNLGLCGGSRASALLHGLGLPSQPTGQVLSLCLEDVTIGGFSGSGISGSLESGSLINCHLAYNKGWGIDVSAGNIWQDAFIDSCYLYFNRQGNLQLAGPGTSAQLEILSTRFDRAGDNVDRARAPWTPGAPGVHLSGATLIRFTNCTTDANMGNGVEVVHDTALSPAYVPNNIQFVNCMFTRDGSGDPTIDTAGLKVVGGAGSGSTVNNVSCVNCAVGSGFRLDGANSGPSGPKHAVWFDNTAHFQWIGGNAYSAPDTFPGTDSYHSGSGNNYRPVLVDIARGLMPLPRSAPDPSIGGVPEGYVYLESSQDSAGNVTRRLKAWIDGAWRSVVLT